MTLLPAIVFKANPTDFSSWSGVIPTRALTIIMALVPVPAVPRMSTEQAIPARFPTRPTPRREAIPSRQAPLHNLATHPGAAPVAQDRECFQE